MADRREELVLGREVFDEHRKVWQGRGWVKTIILPLLVMAVMTVALPGVLAIGLNKLYELPEPLSLGTVGGMVISTPLLVYAIVKISKISLRDLGFIGRKWLKTWLLGAALSLVAVSAVVGAAYLSAAIEISFKFQSASVWMLLFGFVFFAFQGMSEEIVYRLYFLPAFAAKLGVAGAIGVSSLLFAVLHLGNPNMTAVGMINLVLYGVFFAAIYWRFGNAWLVAGYHTGWNFLLSMFYGSYVSGIQLADSVFGSAPVAGSNLLSGGIFGLEGSVWTTVIGLAVIVWCFYTKPPTFKNRPIQQ